jgi:hypothetical protein
VFPSPFYLVKGKISQVEFVKTWRNTTSEEMF